MNNFALTTNNGNYTCKLSVTFSAAQTMVECLSLFYYYFFLREKAWVEERGRGREIILSRLHAQHGAQLGARSHDSRIMNWALSTYISNHSFPGIITGLSFCAHTKVTVSSTIFLDSYSVLSDFPEGLPSLLIFSCHLHNVWMKKSKA